MNRDKRGTLEDTLFAGIIEKLVPTGDSKPFALTLYLGPQHADAEEIFKVQVDLQFLLALTRLQAVCVDESLLTVVGACPGYELHETVLHVSRNHFWLTHVREDTCSQPMPLVTLLDAVRTRKAPLDAILKNDVLIFSQRGTAEATAEGLYYAGELTQEFFDYEMPAI